MSYRGSATLVGSHAAAIPAPPPARCLNHSTAVAEWQCMGCGQKYCTACLNSRMIGHANVLQCPACGNEPVSLAAPQVRASFYQKLLGAAAYPLKGWGGLLVLFGAIMIWATAFACQFSLRALPVGLAMAGYYFSYLILVMNKTGDGVKEMPNWP